MKEFFDVGHSPDVDKLSSPMAHWKKSTSETYLISVISCD